MNIGIIGGHKCSEETYKKAYILGTLLAGENWTLICGGGFGVMEAACKGARDSGGLSVGILPGSGTDAINPYLSVRLPTGMGLSRNVLVVQASDFLVAFPGEYGTLSEIAFGLNIGKSVVGINTWDIPGINKVDSPEEAVRYIRKSNRFRYCYSNIT